MLEDDDVLLVVGALHLGDRACRRCAGSAV
jgi:hypothetical protein